MQNEIQEHPAETAADHTPEDAPAQAAPAARPESIRSSQDGPLMNIPAADVVDAGASAAPAAKVDPAEVAILAQAEDPGVSSRRLRELAMEHPHARPAIAANPAASADLLTWLRGLGDPAVDAALARRSTAG
ncbi:hypothetical protein BN1051_03023 [Arthrobacter saudimassiliensis]|uniref:Leucine rich repeat variant domain-containing protein n=1 Tax=Arthrobacter saudimassiliensis TaxID=1461584 RepID=A0A078MXX3_9MICC|nr:hypothetical protein BN1051_03023 [Arthrobacter saudimassiliensis]